MSTDNSREEIRELQAQIRKLKKNNLGLVFEDKVEDVVEQSKVRVPVLKKVVKNCLDFGEEYPNNLMIEGDNYLALSVLNYTHKNSIDLIYIDPPYNTGKHDFIYNDQYVDPDDGYRHSKWLSFMDNRLRLARSLLKDEGVIFISIDDNEQAHLRILCDKIFGEKNFTSQFIWRRSGTGGLRGAFPVTTHEYVLAYAKNISSLLDIRWMAPYSQDSLAAFNEVDKRGKFKTQALYLTSLKQTKSQSYYIELPDGTFAKPPQGVGSWRFIKQTYEDELRDGNIVFKKVKNSPLVKKDGTKADYNIYTKQYMSDEGTNPSTILPDDIVGQTRAAKAELSKIFETVSFDYAKPTSLIEYILQLPNKKTDVTILDFFAGTGTTGHAVLKLNTKDNGNRKFILCTNNEDNNGSGKKIATDICYPRIKKVIEGYGDIEGMRSNLFYYQTDLVNIEQVRKVPDDAKIRITYQAGEMIAVREGALNEVEKNDWWQIFEGNGKQVAIYFKEDKAKLAELIAKLEKKSMLVALYIFSWGKNEYNSEYSTANIRVEDIPEPILEVYRELNRI